MTSDGTLDLDIGQVTLDDTTDFTIISDACSNTVVPFSGQGTCQIVVQFNPASAGLKTANLTIPSNTTNTDSTINQQSIVQFSGTGIKYGISIAPAALSFGMILLPDDNEAGNIPSGCTDNQNGTVSCPVTITNTGSTAVSNISLSTGNGPFTVSPTTIASLAVNASAERHGDLHRHQRQNPPGHGHADRLCRQRQRLDPSDRSDKHQTQHARRTDYRWMGRTSHCP